MGQRQNYDEIVYGADCIRGFPDAGETPIQIYARFSLIEKCPDIPPRTWFTPPNDRVFKLVQSDINPCLWVYFDDNWLCYVTIPPAPGQITFLLLDRPWNATYFSKLIDVPLVEGTVYANDLQNCNLNAAHKGIAALTWRLESIKLLNGLNILTAYKLFMEMWPLENGTKVYKYCNLTDDTNIKILVEAP